MSEITPMTAIDEYIATCDEKIQERLHRLTQLIRENVPKKTIEKISWEMPTFSYKGNLVHFACHKSHIGFYPGAEAIEHFLPRLKDYKTSKGTVQFQHSKELPEALIVEIVQFSVKTREAAKSK